MKKLVAALLSLIMLFSLAACGSDASPAKDSPVNDPPASAEPTAEPTAEPVVEPQPEEPTESTYYGTWEVVSIEQNGISATVEALGKNGNYNASHIGLILCEDGTGCLYVQDEQNMLKWNITEEGISVNNVTLPLINNRLVINMDDGTVCYLEKVSDDQTIPEPSAEPTTEPSAEAGLRPEFKEAMDSYEAFYAEYCDLLKKYMNNPSDLSILTKYMSLMGKLSDMDEKFKAWESEDLNNEELKYYMDVNNRVMKKLLDVTG